MSYREKQERCNEADLQHKDIVRRDGDMTQSVIVCGSGGVGLTLASTLANLGWSVRVADCKHRPRSGSLNAYGVLSMRDRPITSPLRLLQSEALKRWPDFYEYTLQLGSIEKADVTEWVSSRKVSNHEILRDDPNRNCVESEKANWDSYVDHSDFSAALRIPALFIDPAKVMDALKKKCIDQGVIFETFSSDQFPYLGITNESEKTVSVSGKTADLVVWATGAWAHENLSSHLKLPHGYVKEHVTYQTFECSDLEPRMGLTHDGFMGKREGSDTWVMGGESWQPTSELCAQLKNIKKREGFRGRMAGRYPVFGLDPRGYSVYWAYGFHRIGWILAPLLPTLFRSQLTHRPLSPAIETAFRAILPDRYIKEPFNG